MSGSIVSLSTLVDYPPEIYLYTDMYITQLFYGLGPNYFVMTSGSSLMEVRKYLLTAIVIGVSFALSSHCVCLSTAT